MNWRALPRRAFPYLIAAAGGFLLSYAAVFLFAFPAQVLPDDGILPNVVGKTYEDAAGILSQAGFPAQQGESRYHKSIPANIVLQEDTPAGSRQKRVTTVVLAVSDGQKTAGEHRHPPASRRGPDDFCRWSRESDRLAFPPTALYQD